MGTFVLDDRPIRRVGWEPSPYTDGDIYNSVAIGEDGVTRIDATEQYLGEYSIVWIQIWKDDRIVARYNARNIDSVYYLETEDESA